MHRFIRVLLTFTIKTVILRLQGAQPFVSLVYSMNGSASGYSDRPD